MASSSNLRWDFKSKLPEVARYDLAISYEFILNLTEMQGKLSIKRFCETSKTIHFSAAFPEQDGIENTNDQWHPYWYDTFNSFSYNYLRFSSFITAYKTQCSMENPSRYIYLSKDKDYHNL